MADGEGDVDMGAGEAAPASSPTTQPTTPQGSAVGSPTGSSGAGGAGNGGPGSGKPHLPSRTGGGNAHFGAGGGHASKGHGGTDGTPQAHHLSDAEIAASIVAGGALNHELNVGEHLFCKYRDGTYRAAAVIDKRVRTTEEGQQQQMYYVHYLEFNRRMDTWVSVDDCKEQLPAPVGSSRRADVLENLEDHDNHDGVDLKEHEEVTKVKNVNKIEIGKYVMDTWYFSPFPKEYYPDGVTDVLHFCEYCLSFFRFRSELRRHQVKCTIRHPPGDEIYRHNGISMFEVNGSVCTIYCQNLCYLSKLFLDHKTLYWDVDPFLFYVMCEVDEYGFHFVGYFSKEKYSDVGFNLACILTLPAHQRKGYGRFLIQFSYELSKIEGKVGSPEKPLSDLGLLSYRSYWSWVLLNALKKEPRSEISIFDIVRTTSIMVDDVVATLQYLDVLQYHGTSYYLVITPELIDERLARLNAKVGPEVAPDKIHWSPFLHHVKKDKFLISNVIVKNPEDVQ